MTQIKTNQKPTETDAHFKYRCPNPKCGLDHWISLREAKTSGFLVVCNCEQVFSPETIVSINIQYSTQEEKPEPVTPKEVLTEDDGELLPLDGEDTEPEPTLIAQEIPVDLLSRCCKILVSLGYTQSESREIIESGFRDSQILNPHDLVKHSLKILGGLNEQCDEAI